MYIFCNPLYFRLLQVIQQYNNTTTQIHIFIQANNILHLLPIVTLILDQTIH
jgi:hypothetical protein